MFGIEKRRREDVIKLFDSQMETLKSRGCPWIILEALQEKRDDVLSRVIEMRIPKGHIPFIAVIPLSVVYVETLMKTVIYDHNKGHSLLIQSELSNIVGVPSKPYFMFDVENGKAMLNKSSEEAEKRIGKQRRSCLTVGEGIALCIHTNVLYKHFVNCAGSRHKNGYYVPIVHLSNDKPMLNWIRVESWYSNCGSPSCFCRA